MGLIKKDTTAVRTEPIEIKNSEVNTNNYGDSRDTKTKQIQAQGCWQAACQSSVLQMFCQNFEEYRSKVKELAEDGLMFIQEKSN